MMDKKQRSNCCFILQGTISHDSRVVQCNTCALSVTPVTPVSVEQKLSDENTFGALKPLNLRVLNVIVSVPLISCGWFAMAFLAQGSERAAFSFARMSSNSPRQQRADAIAARHKHSAPSPLRPSQPKVDSRQKETRVEEWGGHVIQM